MKVAVVTGTRAEYGIWRPVLQALRGTPGINVQLVVTGMHLLKEFGTTARMVEADARAEGWAVAARVEMYRRGVRTADSLARGVAGLGRAFDRLDPDVVLVLGDRLEMLAAAQAAMCQRRLVGHLHGGEVAPGQFDEQIRHAITKLAHLHFAATKEAAKRIVQMGEDPQRVFIAGAPALDAARDAWEVIRQIPKGPMWPVLVLHPTTGNDQTEYRQAKLVVRVLRRYFTGRAIPTIGPNNDPGHKGILRAYRELSGAVKLEMSVPQEIFWTALGMGRLLVGNSSSGIIEAATLRCAAINIGDRQAGREHRGNVIDTAFNERQIAGAIERVLSDKAFSAGVARGRNIYGDGRAGKRIARILQHLHPQKLPRAKRFYEA